MKLQKRERYLLIFLCIILLIAALYFIVILPQIEALDSKKIEFEELEVKRIKVETVISQLTAVDAEVKALQGEADNLVKLMGLDESFDVSLLLSDLQVKHNMLPESIAISAASLASTPVVKNTSSDAETNAADTATVEPPKVAFVRTVSLTTSGKEEDAWDFLDALSGYNPGLLIDSYYFSSGGDGRNVYTMSITMYQFAEPDWSAEATTINY